MKAEKVAQLEALSAAGIRLFLKVEQTSQLLSENYEEELAESMAHLLELFPYLEGILWESDVAAIAMATQTKARSNTVYDLVQKELKAVEGALSGRSLIYHTACSDEASMDKQLTWFESLLDDAGPMTTIAFPALAGAPWQDHHLMHPLWEQLRQASDASATPLLPILNSGAMSQGEGLWPSLPLDHIESVLDKMQGEHIFSGAISMAATVPQKGCLLDASLWVAGQALWHGKSPRLLLESWLQQELTSNEAEKAICLFREARSLSLELSQMRTLEVSESPEKIVEEQGYRSQAESLLARLNELKRKSGAVFDGESLYPYYFCYFVRDAKRLLFSFLQAHHIAMASVFTGDDVQESFWTTMASNASKGIGFGTNLDFLNRPNRGEDGSPMATIYDLSRMRNC